MLNRKDGDRDKLKVATSGVENWYWQREVEKEFWKGHPEQSATDESFELLADC